MRLRERGHLIGRFEPTQSNAVTPSFEKREFGSIVGQVPPKAASGKAMHDGLAMRS